jgi:DNA-binding response OmpR family regulator
MPAQIVLVHDDPAFTEPLSRALVASGFEVMVFPDPLVSLDALEAARRLELLITRVEFPVGHSNGGALALMARHKRPGVKVLLVCRPEYRKDVEDLGEVLATPVTVAEVADAAVRLMLAVPRTKERVGMKVRERGLR